MNNKQNYPNCYHKSSYNHCTSHPDKYFSFIIRVFHILVNWVSFHFYTVKDIVCNLLKIIQAKMKTPLFTIRAPFLI